MSSGRETLPLSMVKMLIARGHAFERDGKYFMRDGSEVIASSQPGLMRRNEQLVKLVKAADYEQAVRLIDRVDRLNADLNKLILRAKGCQGAVPCIAKSHFVHCPIHTVLKKSKKAKLGLDK